jgi:hypothetical protein
MSTTDAAPTPADVAPAQDATDGNPPADATTEPPKQDETDWKAEARKWEARAKENSGHAKAAEKARLDAMSESERAIEEAKQAARSEAALSFGKRLARTEFDAHAGRRNPDYDSAAALEFIDLARFVGEDGEPDVKAIKAAVERLVPAASTPTPSFDGGTRTPPPVGVDMNTALRKATGRA